MCSSDEPWEPPPKERADSHRFPEDLSLAHQKLGRTVGRCSRPEGDVIEARIGLQAALNGDRTRDEHAAVPVSVEELARDAAACVAAGARAIHLHPRGPEGRETLDAGVVNEVVTEVRRACGVPGGVTTSAEIEPDPERRLALVRSWHARLRQEIFPVARGARAAVDEDDGLFGGLGAALEDRG